MSLRAHRSDAERPGDRGRELGLAHPAAVANTVAFYRRLLQEVTGAGEEDLARAGERVGDGLAHRWPDLVEELEGIALGAGQPPLVLLAVNARTELLGGAVAAAECSLVGRVEAGACTVAQTWDWHPDLAPSLLLWSVRQPGGRWFATLTEAGILAKLGVSSAGLCCGLNFLRSSADGGVGGVPIHVLLRVLLDRTDSLVDALHLLLNAGVSASSCVTVGWADGAEAGLVAAELSPSGCELVWPDAGGRLAHTNHFLVPPRLGRDLEPAEAPSTLVRLWALNRSAEPAAALRSHLGAPEAVCRHARVADPWPERRATLASVVMEAAERRLRVGPGAPCEAALEEVALP